MAAPREQFKAALRDLKKAEHNRAMAALKFEAAETALSQAGLALDEARKALHDAIDEL